MEIWDTGGAGITDKGLSFPETIQRKLFVVGGLIVNGFGVAAMPLFHDGQFHLYSEEAAREITKITMPIRNQFMPVNNDPNLAGIFNIE